MLGDNSDDFDIINNIGSPNITRIGLLSQDTENKLNLQPKFAVVIAGAGSMDCVNNLPYRSGY